MLKAEGRDTGGRATPPPRSRRRPRACPPTAKCVSVTTDLHITGKVAQFGRGIIGDVSKKLMAQFAGNLNTMLDEQRPARPRADEPTTVPADSARPPRPSDGRRRRSGQPVDGGADASARSTVPPPSRSTSPATAGPAILKRLLPAARRARGAACSLRATAALTRQPVATTDRDRVRALLGGNRPGAFEVVVRDADGDPVVIRNAPLLDDGTPMPTRYWLVGPAQVRAVSRLEAAGGVRAAEAAVDPAALADAHARYAAERDAALPPTTPVHRPTGGVGGTRARRQVPARPLRLVPGRRRRPGRPLGGRQLAGSVPARRRASPAPARRRRCSTTT